MLSLTISKENKGGHGAVGGYTYIYMENDRGEHFEYC